jgi:hypothetical protein
LLAVRDMIDPPTWAVRAIRQRALVARNPRQDRDINEILRFHANWETLADCAIIRCETTGSSVWVVRNIARRERLLVWDVGYFAQLEAAATLLLQPPMAAQPHVRLKATLACVVLRSAAERTFLKDPYLARAAFKMSGDIYRGYGLTPSQPQPPDPARFLLLVRYMKWVTYFHEIGHELYRSNPELVANLEEKIDIAVGAVAASPEKIALANDNAIDDARIVLREGRIIRPKAERLAEIRESLGDLDTPEESWCDLFAVEQIVLHSVVQRTDPTDLYLAIMLKYYMTALVQQACKFFDRSVSDAEYSSMSNSRGMATRADLRATHLMGTMVEILLRPFKKDLEEYGRRWIEDHYPLLARFHQLEEMIGKALSPELRPMVLTQNKRWADGLSEQKRIEHLVDLRTSLGWDRPVF